MASTERQAQDHAFMRRALELAERGWGQTAPNPMVGAVVVAQGTIVGEGYHATFGAPHAEVIALRAAGDRARGATLYVTLEPCNHTGKTPPCTDSILAAGVSRVVIASNDPNPVAAGGTERLRTSGITVDVGVADVEARELNAAFFHVFVSDRPWVILKLALSLDGAMTDARRSSGWLTGASARREVHHMRAGADAIAVGVGTVIADDPQLTVRDVTPPRVAPRRVVFDSSLRTPLEANVVRTARDVPTILVARDLEALGARAAAFRERGVQLMAAATLPDALRAIAASGVRALLVEGGAILAGSLLRESLVDRLVIFQAPVILGGGAQNAFAHAPQVAVSGAKQLHVVSRKTFGDDLMTTYAFGSSAP